MNSQNQLYQAFTPRTTFHNFVEFKSSKNFIIMSYVQKPFIETFRIIKMFQIINTYSFIIIPYLL